MSSGSDQALSFTTTKPIDKIYYKPPTATVAVTQSASATSPTWVEVPLTHDKGQTFFIAMQLSPDGDTWYDPGYEPAYYNTVQAAYFPRFRGQWKVDNTTVTLRFYALDSSYTMYYRLVGYTKE